MSSRAPSSRRSIHLTGPIAAHLREGGRNLSPHPPLRLVDKERTFVCFVFHLSQRFSRCALSKYCRLLCFVIGFVGKFSYLNLHGCCLIWKGSSLLCKACCLMILIALDAAGKIIHMTILRSHLHAHLRCEV